MALAYRPPGVSVDEVVSPSIAPLLAVSASVCLVGLTQGYQVRTDQFVLSGTGAIALPGIPTGATLSSVVSVKDALDPSKGQSDGSGYTLTTDYTVQAGTKTITRVGAGAIADNTLVNVTYQYVPEDYYTAYRLDSFSAIEARYGSAYSADGTAINSVVSLAASIAFENGASDVVIQPLFSHSTPGDHTSARIQPANAAAIAALSTWSDTLYALRDIEDINIIVPVIGQSQASVGDSQMLAIEQAVQDHIKFMKEDDQEIFGIFGEDSNGNSPVSAATLRSHGTTLRARYGGILAEQTVLVNTAKFPRSVPAIGQSIYVGGQYVAAAIAGMIAARSVSDPITRQDLSGFNGVSEARNKSEKAADANAGLLVIEQRGSSVRVRHGITLDNTSVARQEISVVRAKHRMIESVKDTLETQIIGRIIADGNAPLVVRSAVIGVLEQLRQGRELVDYSNVEARALTLDPTHIEVRFSYRPAMPLNYVSIKFSLDLTSGDITPTDSTSVGV